MSRLSIRNIRQIFAYDVAPEAATLFLEGPQSDIPTVTKCVASDAGVLCYQSDITITATDSKDPVFPGSADADGKKSIGIGSHQPERRGYREGLFKHIDHIFADTLLANSETGDLIRPLNKGLTKENNIHALGELIMGKDTLSRRSTPFRITRGGREFAPKPVPRGLFTKRSLPVK